MEINWAGIIENVMFIIISLGVPFIVKYIRDRNKVEKFDKVLEYAEIAVRFAEQYYYKMDGKVKYQYASDWLATQALKVGIKLTDEEIRGIIEGTLLKISKEFTEVWDEVKEESEQETK